MPTTEERAKQFYKGWKAARAEEEGKESPFKRPMGGWEREEFDKGYAAYGKANAIAEERKVDKALTEKRFRTIH